MTGQPQRGELWWADLGEPRGSSPALRRPVLIVQSDAFNRSRLRTVVAAAVTTNTALASMPGNVFVAATIGGLTRDSVVNVMQLATVDKTFLEQRIGTLPDHLLGEVDRGIRGVLQL